MSSENNNNNNNNNNNENLEEGNISSIPDNVPLKALELLGITGNEEKNEENVGVNENVGNVVAYEILIKKVREEKLEDIKNFIVDNYVQDLSLEQRNKIFENMVLFNRHKLIELALGTGYFSSPVINDAAIDTGNFEYVKLIKNKTLTNNQRKKLKEKYFEEYQTEIENMFPELITQMTIIKGIDLRICDNNNLSDPYVTVLDTDYKELFKTKTIKKTLNPVWNETFDIDFYEETKLHIRVEDEDFVVDDIEGIFHLDVGNNCYEINKEYEFKLRVSKSDRDEDIEKFGEDYNPKNSIVFRFN
eukprot:TRINITY_DN2864_c1_g1_i1.p1 TRINITY_DN2864_c1_g1~~TRINITY_DN2864_c1_g1_i1.p1  ORF type:complete len:303 (-),score=99.60 TRINITY_DN2864_c1_g1_i1:131-1039(-)